MPIETATKAEKAETKAETRTRRRVRFVVRGMWRAGELLATGCTWRIVRADDSGHRMLLPASDVRDGEQRDGKEAGATRGE